MKEQLISFETAKLAEKKGFNEPTYWHWEIGSGDVDTGSKESLFTSGDNLQNDQLMESYEYKFVLCGEWSAPTQSLLQKWLREKHIIQIQIEWDTITYDGLVWHPDDNGDYKTTGHDFYEEALEQCLKYALNLIK